MKRRIALVLVSAMVSVALLATPASASPWEKLFGCDGYFPISCPGPVPW